MANLIKFKRGTRSQLEAAASSSGLLQGEPYLITDDGVIAIGTGTTGYFYLNNRKPRVSELTSSSSVTPDINTYDIISFSTLATNLSIANPSGTPYDGQELIIRIADNGVARTITWGDIYRRISSTALPTITLVNKILTLKFIYFSGLSVWACVEYNITNIPASNISYIGGGYGGTPDSPSGTYTITLSDIFGSGVIQENDLIIGAVGVGSNSAVIGNPLTSSGWTSTTIGQVTGTSTNTISAYGFYKLMSSSPDTTLAFTKGGVASRAMFVLLRAYRGVNTSTPIDTTTTVATGTTGAYPNPPSNTLANTGAVSVVFGLAPCGSSNTPNFTSSDLGNYFSNQQNGVSTGAAGGCGDKFVSAAFDPTTFSGGTTGNGLNPWAAGHYILRSS